MLHPLIQQFPPSLDKESIEETAKWYGLALGEYEDYAAEDDPYLEIYRWYREEKRAPKEDVIVLSEEEYSSFRSEGECTIDANESTENALISEYCIILEQNKPQERLIWTRVSKKENSRIILEKMVDLPISREDSEEGDDTPAQEQFKYALNPMLSKTTYHHSNGFAQHDGNWRDILSFMADKAPKQRTELLRNYRDGEKKCELTGKKASECGKIAILPCCFSMFDEKALCKYHEGDPECPVCFDLIEDKIVIDTKHSKSGYSVLIDVLRSINLEKEVNVVVNELPFFLRSWRCSVDDIIIADGSTNPDVEQKKSDDQLSKEDKQSLAQSQIVVIYTKKPEALLQNIMNHADDIEEVHVIV